MRKVFDKSPIESLLAKSPAAADQNGLLSWARPINSINGAATIQRIRCSPILRKEKDWGYPYTLALPFCSAEEILQFG